MKHETTKKKTSNGKQEKGRVPELQLMIMEKWQCLGKAKGTNNGTIKIFFVLES